MNKTILLTLAAFLSTAEAAPTRNGIAVTSTGRIRHWDSLPIQICPSQDLPQSAKSSFKEAADIWNKSFPKPIFNTDCQGASTNFEEKSAAEHTVYWVTKNFGKSGDPLSIARTVTSFDEDTGKYLDADILLNAEAFEFNKLKIDLTSVFVHELGHVLGLQHLFASQASCMNQYPYQSGIQRRNLETYEKASISMQYFKGKNSLPKYIDPYFNGELKNASKSLRESKKRDADSLYAEGFIALKSKDYSAAHRTLTAAIALDPKNPIIRYQQTQALLGLNKSVEAEKELSKLVQAWPNYYEALADLALIKLKKGDSNEAKKLFQKTLEINPVHYPACYFLYEITKKQEYVDCVKRLAPDLLSE